MKLPVRCLAALCSFLPVLVSAETGAATQAVTATASANGTTLTAKLVPASRTVRVEIGGDLFTELIYGGQPKPVLFPIHGPGGAMMVRQWPLRPAAPGEETDHPHHKGLWFTHGNVNGLDFWKEGADAGKIIVQGIPQLSAVEGSVVLQTRESWQKPDATEVLQSETRIACGVEGEDRYIDYTITLSATGTEVLFGDTKEGTMGIRVNPLLNFKGAVAKGTALTSEGKTGAAAWGTNAKWVDYTAPMGGGVLGVACFDHPSNLQIGRAHV